MKEVDRYEVTVWDIVNGDIVHKEWDCDQETLDYLYEEYEDDLCQVVVDKEWQDYE